MKDRRVRAWLQIIGSGVGSLAAWRIELREITGWAGTRWIYTFPWSSLVVCALVGCTVLAALRPARSWTIRRSVILVASVAAVSWGAFLLARQGELNTETIPLMPGLRTEFLQSVVLPLVAGFLLASVGIHLVSRRYGPATVVDLLRIMLAIGLTLPLSLLTVKVWPPGSGRDDYIHSVKMGYPMFWINPLLGWALWPLGTRAAKVKGEPDPGGVPK